MKLDGDSEGKRECECGCPSIDFYLCFMGRKMIEPTEGDNRHEMKCVSKC